MNSNTGAGPEPTETFPPPQPLWRLTVVEVTSVVLFSFRKTRTVVGSLEECEALYNRARTHNLVVGWWSLFGIFWNLPALSSNKRALSKLRGLAGDGVVAAGWRSDPSGRHLQRYWDGQHWTDQVADQTTDSA